MIQMDMHIHSSYSDGADSPEEIITTCIKQGYFQIAVTDHVRRTTTWVERFAEELAALKTKYADRIGISSAVEAKVLDLDGNLDFAPEERKFVDLVYGALHRIPSTNGFLSREEMKSSPSLAVANWEIATCSMLRRREIDVLAHPTAILDINGLSAPSEAVRRVAGCAVESGVFFEINSKYPLRESVVASAIKANAAFSFGSDSHRAFDIPCAESGPQSWFIRHFGEPARVLSASPDRP